MSSQKTWDVTWSFGQVTAVVLLAAPLISIIEYFMEGESGDYYLEGPSFPGDILSLLLGQYQTQRR
jgi:hypothetical protein